MANSSNYTSAYDSSSLGRSFPLRHAKIVHSPCTPAKATIQTRTRYLLSPRNPHLPRTTLLLLLLARGVSEATYPIHSVVSEADTNDHRPKPPHCPLLEPRWTLHPRHIFASRQIIGITRRRMSCTGKNSASLFALSCATSCRMRILQIVQPCPSS